MIKKILSIFITCLLLFSTACIAETTLPCPLNEEEAQQNGWQPPPFIPPSGNPYNFNFAQIQRRGNSGSYTYLAICIYNDASFIIPPGYMKTSRSRVKPEIPLNWDSETYPTTCGASSDKKCQFVFGD